MKFYSEQFKGNTGCVDFPLVEATIPLISDAMNEGLVAKPSIVEVHEVVFALMGPFIKNVGL